VFQPRPLHARQGAFHGVWLDIAKAVFDGWGPSLRESRNPIAGVPSNAALLQILPTT
jgi:hypothetical protein